MCKYSDITGYKCPHENLEDNKYCIFHLQDDNKDVDEFNKGIKEILETEEDSINFNGFYFPPGTSDFSAQNFKTKSEFFKVKFLGEANFSGATFSEDVNFSQATFSEDANFNFTTFSEESHFNVATFSKNADFSEATFAGEGDFSCAIFSEKANFSDATFSEELDFSDATFSEADFINSKFSEAYFIDATFSEAYFINSKFSGETNFNQATFLGEANFSEATFSEEANFIYATFSGEADFREATFSGKAYFTEATFSEEANFIGARFSGNTDFNEATFSEDGNFTRVTFSGTTNFSFATFSGKANFWNAELLGKFAFILNEYETLIFENTYFSDNVRIKADLSKCSFANSNIERVDMTDSSWMRDDDIPKKSFSAFYEWIRNKVGLSDTSIKIWEEYQGELKDNWKELEGIYRRLKQSYQKFGDTSTAGKFYYQEMECKRKQLKGIEKHFWYLFYKKLCGYGEKPFNVIGYSGLIVLASSLFFFYWGIELLGSEVLDVTPRVIDYKLSLDSSGIQWAKSNFYLFIGDWLECLYTSVITFTTLGYGDVHPIGFSRIIASVEAGFGIIMTALFIFVFTRKMLR